MMLGNGSGAKERERVLLLSATVSGVDGAANARPTKKPGDLFIRLSKRR
jgi:hypothetical protein